MRAREFKQLLVMATRMTAGQREQVLAQIGTDKALDEATAIVQSEPGETRRCPKCGGARLVRNGQANGLQRYKCRACGVTFNALTGRWQDCVNAINGFCRHTR